MNVIKAGSIWKICGDNLLTSKTLPPLTYKVGFAKREGFFLEEYSDLTVKEEKLYGSHLNKVDKVMSAFSEFGRSLGVILSGDKGIGKSLLARLICLKGQENNLPVIVVSQAIPGIADYISSIDQESIVLFDEFEKVFGEDGEDESGSVQNSLLSLFDGVAPGKKLYVVTCNKVEDLNEYLVNRPGRFHYHFRFKYPSPDEVREYLNDKLDPKYFGEIEKVVNLSGRISLNYDCLRAIAFELNRGDCFEDAIKDLNIINIGYKWCDIKILLDDGTSFGRSLNVDTFSNTEDSFDVKDETGKNGAYTVTYVPSSGVYREDLKAIFYAPDTFKIEVYRGFNEDKQMGNKGRNLPKVIGMTLKVQGLRSIDCF